MSILGIFSAYWAYFEHIFGIWHIAICPSRHIRAYFGHMFIHRNQYLSIFWAYLCPMSTFMPKLGILVAYFQHIGIFGHIGIFQDNADLTGVMCFDKSSSDDQRNKYILTSLRRFS